MTLRRIAIVGGTGLNTMEGVREIRSHSFETPYGAPSTDILELCLEKDETQRFFFLPRHGKPHTVAPHLINYRANIHSLHQLGITDIIAVNAVGGIDPTLKPKDIVVPNQLIDYTLRDSTFFDGVHEALDHIDFSDPFCPDLMQVCFESAKRAGISVVEGGVYGVTQGPRLETAAEIKRMHNDGATLVGMTLMPEAVLAREKKIRYACLSLVVNPAAGVSSSVITMDEIYAAIKDGMGDVQKVLISAISQLAE